MPALSSKNTKIGKHYHIAAQVLNQETGAPDEDEVGAAVTPAAHVDPPTATPQAIAEALIAAGLMEEAS